MKAKKPKSKIPTPEERASMAKDYLADAEKRGELDPKHGQQFGRLLDGVAPPAPAKKK